MTTRDPREKKCTKCGKVRILTDGVCKKCRADRVHEKFVAGKLVTLDEYMKKHGVDGL